MMKTLRGFVVLEPLESTIDIPGITMVDLRALTLEKKIFASKRDIKRHAETGTTRLRLLTADGTATFPEMALDMNDIAEGGLFPLCDGDIIILNRDILKSFMFNSESLAIAS